MAALDVAPAPIPTPIGRGPRFQLPARTAGACLPGPREGRFRAHIELFAVKRVVLIPAGVGLRPGCRARVRTLDPTGVVHFDRRPLTLGALFDVWRARLSPTRLLSFRGPVSAFVAGRRWRGDPRAIPLDDGAQIVVEIGGFIPPHAVYLFPPR